MWCVTHQPFHARQQPVPSRLTTTGAGTTPPSGASHAPTMQARSFASVSTLAGATRGQSAILPTGAGSQTVVDRFYVRVGTCV